MKYECCVLGNSLLGAFAILRPLAHTWSPLTLWETILFRVYQFNYKPKQKV